MKMQNIILELSNGERVVATVPEFIKKEGEDIQVRKVMVTPPRELPDGCTFTNIELESEE